MPLEQQFTTGTEWTAGKIEPIFRWTVEEDDRPFVVVGHEFGHSPELNPDVAERADLIHAHLSYGNWNSRPSFNVPSEAISIFPLPSP